jgi:hypothetical protein
MTNNSNNSNSNKKNNKNDKNSINNNYTSNFCFVCLRDLLFVLPNDRDCPSGLPVRTHNAVWRWGHCQVTLTVHPMVVLVDL